MKRRLTGRILTADQHVPNGNEVDPHWLNRLVRVEVDLDEDKSRIYRLRRREPKDQPILKELHHHIKKRRFSE